MNIDTSKIISELKKHSNKSNISGMARFGITGKDILGGPNVPILRKMARDIKKQANDTHHIALELWSSGIHEAKLLATMIEDPKRVSGKQMDDWVLDFDSWDVCDQACMNLFDKTKSARSKVLSWSKRNEEYVKRASFALMASIAVHDKSVANREFKIFFDIIVRECTDERNYVRKAVNWALRQIGKRNSELRKDALKVTEEILKIENKTARWIALDAKRELEKRS